MHVSDGNVTRCGCLQAADRFSDSSLMVKLEGGELILDGMPRVSLHLEDTTDIHVSELQILIQNKYFCLSGLPLNYCLT